MRGRLLVDLGVELKNGAGGELAKAVTPSTSNVGKPDLGVPRYAGIQRFWTYCLNAKSSEERVVYKKAELNGNVDSENNHGGSSRTYVLHRTGCSQEDEGSIESGCGLVLLGFTKKTA